MTLQQIAQQVSEEYNREPSDLLLKHYSNKTNIHNMKIDFVVKAREEGFTNRAIANFMEYAESSTSELYTIGMAGENIYRYQELLSLLKEGKAVSRGEFKNVGQHAAKLRELGHNVFKSHEGYKLG